MNRITRWSAVFIVSGALFLGACNRSQTSAVQTPDDNAITSDIQAKLFQDPVLKTRDIKVEAQKGVVVIGGTVASDVEKSAVENIANHEPGVKQVIDQLAVAAPQAAAPQPVPDLAPRSSSRRASARHATRHADEMAGAAPAPQAQQAVAQPAPAPVVERPADAAPAPAPQPVQVTVPAGTVVTVRMIDSVDSKTSQPGQEFAASLENPIVSGDRVVIPKGADARIRLVNASQSGKFKGRAELALELVQLSTNGTSYDVTSGYYTQQGASRGRRTAESVGGGAALGAIIGAIAGGRKGAAIGAGAGAGVGGGVEAASARSEVKVPSETKIDFTLKSPFTITMSPR